MPSLHLIVTVALSLVETIIGLLLNCFILAVSIQDQNEDFTLSPSKQIQFSMGLTNVIIQSMLTIEGYVSVLSPVTMFSKEFSTVIVFVHFFLNYFSSWLPTWLCSFYCVTIVRFKHNLMTSLKMGLSVVVPKLLMVTAMGSLGISVPSIWCVEFGIQQKITGNVTNNHTGNDDVIQFNVDFFYGMVFITFGCFLPLTLTVTSIGFTLASLLGHIWRIKLNAFNVNGQQLTTHYRACRTMILLVIFYVTFNLCTATMASFPMSSVSVWSTIVQLYTLWYPTVQAAILISGSSKLKKTFCRHVLSIKQ
ncbi:taste receptor type 2 member 9-like [Discoglossus pictus]